MIGSFGSSLFGSRGFLGRPAPLAGGLVAVLGDTSSHGGSIVSTNQDGTLKLAGIAVAVNGAQHYCPLHGTTPITALTVKTFHNGKLIVTEGAMAACGAIIEPLDRKFEVE